MLSKTTEPRVPPGRVTPPGGSGGVPAGRPGKNPPPDRDEADSGEDGFFRRYRVPLILAMLAAGGAGFMLMGPSAPPSPAVPRKAPATVQISLPPPLPPPPPPPPPPVKVEQPREEQMEEQTPVADESPPEPEPDNSPPPIGTNITGNGPADGFGLGKASGGSGNGTGRRIGGGGSKFGYYASQVQNSISTAVRRHPRTRSSSMTVTVRIWADDTGRVTRAVLAGSSGDPVVDAALKNEVLTGLQLQSPPPAGMKMPINLRLTARAPR